MKKRKKIIIQKRGIPARKRARATSGCSRAHCAGSSWRRATKALSRATAASNSLDVGRSRAGSVSHVCGSPSAHEPHGGSALLPLLPAAHSGGTARHSGSLPTCGTIASASRRAARVQSERSTPCRCSVMVRPARISVTISYIQLLSGAASWCALIATRARVFHCHFVSPSLFILLFTFLRER